MDATKPRDHDETRWHLDKRVPVSIIVTLLLQAGAGLWFAAKMDARLTVLEATRTEQRERDAVQDRAVVEASQLLRVELQYIRGQLDTLIRDQARDRSGK